MKNLKKIAVKNISIIASIFLLSMAGWSVANGSPADDLQALIGVQSLEAECTQTIFSHNKFCSKTTGIMKIQKPKFVWKTQAPHVMEVVCDGAFIWTYDVDLKQVMKQKIGAVMSGSPADLLAGKHLARDFIVQENKHHHRYILKPRAQDTLYEKIILTFKGKKIDQMMIQDTMGQHVQIDFNNVKINSKIDPQVFYFKPKPGVDVIINE